MLARCSSEALIPVESIQNSRSNLLPRKVVGTTRTQRWVERQWPFNSPPPALRTRSTPWTITRPLESWRWRTSATSKTILGGRSDETVSFPRSITRSSLMV